jgi:hypothetical protein
MTNLPIGTGEISAKVVPDSAAPHKMVEAVDSDKEKRPCTVQKQPFNPPWIAYNRAERPIK